MSNKKNVNINQSNNYNNNNNLTKATTLETGDWRQHLMTENNSNNNNGDCDNDYNNK